MVRQVLVSAALAAALAFPPAARAATDAELAEIRDQIRQLRETYEARINALEARLKEAEARAAAAQAQAASDPGGAPLAAGPAAGAPASPSAAAAPTQAVAGAASTPGSAASGIAAFNPAISVVLQGNYASFSQDPSRYAIAGFQKSPDVEMLRRGLGIAESEISISANVDDKFAGSLIVSLSPENTVSVEEAYGFLPALGNGLTPKFGRFFSGIGYQNEQHQHVWDFQDAPLAYQAFLGGQLAQDGVQVKWVAPTDQFLELGAEIGNGEGFPGAPRNHNNLGAAALYVHTGGDIGPSHSWRAGLSYLATRPRDRESVQPDVAGNLADVAFSGTSRTAVADFVWKYAPNGNTRETNVKVQGEYFWRRERGELTYDADGALGLTQTDAYAANQRGWYLQGVWQFRPMWRVGARYDRLEPGRPQYGANSDLLELDFSPQKITAMVDWTPSEFSRFRLQYANSRTRPDLTDHQVFLQYILTLGAHGAHRF